MSSETGHSDLWAALSSQTGDLAEQAGKAVVAIQAEHRVAASGVHWRAGVVVTAAHLVRRAEQVSVLLPGGTLATGTLAGRDATTDLAIVKIKGENNLAILPSTASPRLGEFVLAVARSGRGELSASAGIVSRVGGRWQTWRGGEVDRLLRPDVRLYPGQSGSALVNGRGELLGVNSVVLARESVITLPVETVDRVVDELLERGHIAQPYLGIAIQPVPLPPEWQRTAATSQEHGLLVMHVQPDGPAKKAGITLGDLIVSLDGEAVDGIRGLHQQLTKRHTGQGITVKLLRSGSVLESKIELGDRPRR